jgi:bacterioferritin (cytochrome b1)
MGIFWELMQENRIKEQQDHAKSLEERVATLESELTETRQLLSKILIALEEHIGEDIDGDGKKGR